MWDQISQEEKEITKTFLHALLKDVKDDAYQLENREYLIQHVFPTLIPGRSLWLPLVTTNPIDQFFVKGLISLLRSVEKNKELSDKGKEVLPIKPTDFLAKYLYRHNPRHAPRQVRAFHQASKVERSLSLICRQPKSVTCNKLLKN